MKQTSINIQAVKGGSERHNLRLKDYDYVRKDLTPNNENWMAKSISEVYADVKERYERNVGKKMQKKATPIREGVVVIDENTTMEDLKKLAFVLEDKFKIKCFQIHIHRDEGHHRAKEWKHNLHAHMVFDWTDEYGKSIKLNRYQMSQMQTVLANTLGMERGKSSDKKHLSAIQYKKEATENYLLELEEQLHQAKKQTKQIQEQNKTLLDEIEDKSKELEKKEKKINELEGEIKRLGGDYDKVDVNVYKKKLDGIWGFLGYYDEKGKEELMLKDINGLKQLIFKKDAEIDNLKRGLERVEGELEKSKEARLNENIVHNRELKLLREDKDNVLRNYVKVLDDSSFYEEEKIRIAAIRAEQARVEQEERIKRERAERARAEREEQVKRQQEELRAGRRGFRR